MAKVIQRGISLFIDDKEIKNNVSSVRAEMRKLINEQSKMTMGSDEYVAHAAKIKALNGVINQHKLAVGQIPTFWQKAKDSIVATGFGVLGGNLLTTIGGKISGLFSGIIEGNAELSDSFADIAKTTGMSIEEVEALNKALGKIDTRTSVSDLRNIAIVAGQLGIPKEQVGSFTEAIDKINVALGDEIGGGAEGVADTIGKLRNVMGDFQTGDVAADLMHIGNALNTLGASGFATSPVIADFANRIGGVGIPLGLTSGQVLGLSATLQELNVSTERGGTAVSKILQKMTTNTAAFAKVAGMDVKLFKDLVNTDMMGAFLAVVEGSNKSGDSATALGSIIDSLGMDGAGASEVFMKLGANVELTKDKINMATDALTKNDSITNEFNLKNENFAAKWEKTKKAINGVVVQIQVGLKGVILWMIDALQSSIKWVKNNADTLAFLGKIVLVATTALLSYKAALQLVELWEKRKLAATLLNTVATKAKAVADGIAIVATQLYAAATMLFTGNIKGATQALRVMNTTMKTSPWGLMAALVVAAGTALYMFSENAKEASKATKDLQSIEAESRKEIWAQQQALASLVETAKDETKSKQEREDAIKKINAISPEYLGNITLENIATQQTTESLKLYNEELLRTARIQAAKTKLQEIANEEIEFQTGVTKNELTILQKIQKAIIAASQGGAAAAVYEAKMLGKNIEEKLKEFETRKKQIMDIINKEESQVPKTTPTGTAPSTEPKPVVQEKNTIDDLNKQIEKLERERELRRMTDIAREEAQIRDKYKDLLKQAQNYHKQKKKIEDLMEDEIMDNRIKRENEKAKELRKKALDTEKDLAKKIAEFNIKNEPNELDIDLSNLDTKFSELLRINSDAINSIKQMGIDLTDEDFATLKKLYEQNTQLLDIWVEEEEKIRKKHADKQIEEKQEVEDKIADIITKGNAKEIREIQRKYGELIEQAKKYGLDTTALVKAMNEEIKKLNKKTTASIFGLTEDKFSEIKSAVNTVIQGIGLISDAWSAYNDLQKTKSDNEIAQFEKEQNRKKEALDKRLKKGLISQKRYDAEMAAIDAETENRKKKATIEEAKRQKKLKLFQAASSMASAIIGFLADPGGYPGVAMSIMAGVVGGLQMANIAKQDVESFEQGGYTNGDRIYRAGERGLTEFISPNWMVKNPVSGPIIHDLNQFRMGKPTKFINPDFDNINNSFATSQNSSSYNQGTQPDILVASKIDSLTGEIKNLTNYLSDPNNRRAYMSIDDFKKTTKELDLIEKLSSYGFRKGA